MKVSPIRLENISEGGARLSPKVLSTFGCPCSNPIRYSIYSTMYRFTVKNTTILLCFRDGYKTSYDASFSCFISEHFIVLLNLTLCSLTYVKRLNYCSPTFEINQNFLRNSLFRFTILDSTKP